MYLRCNQTVDIRLFAVLVVTYFELCFLHPCTKSTAVFAMHFICINRFLATSTGHNLPINTMHRPRVNNSVSTVSVYLLREVITHEDYYAKQHPTKHTASNFVKNVIWSLKNIKLLNSYDCRSVSIRTIDCLIFFIIVLDWKVNPYIQYNITIKIWIFGPYAVYG